METLDTCCTIVPYFDIPEENIYAFKELCEKFIKKTKAESKCLYYGFSFNGREAHCREGYKDAEGLMSHLYNIGPLFNEALKIAKISRLEVHGPEKELAKLREPLSNLNPQYFVLEYGFRK